MEEGVTKEDLRQFGLLLIGTLRKMMQVGNEKDKETVHPEWLKSRVVRKLLALQQGKLFRIKVSRSVIMAKSHVNISPTFHKYFKEVQELGYICYRPSYHPGVQSEVDFLKRVNTDK